MDFDDLFVSLATGMGSGAELGTPIPSRLCSSAARLLGCDGGAITMAYTHTERVTLCTTDETAKVLEDTQDVTGQGPGPDAFSTGAYARFDLVHTDGPDPRWPLLESDTLTALAPVVVHAIPMVHAERVLGVLTLHQSGAGTQIDLTAAPVVARMVGLALLADVPASDDLGQGPWAERAEVHQATGMVVAQLGLPARDALALIRAHAYSHDQNVGWSAHAVISRRLTFSTTPDRKIETT